MFKYANNKWLMGVVIAVAVFVLGINTYNEAVTNGTVNPQKVLMESFTTLLAIGAAVNSLLVHKRGLDGEELDGEKMKSKEEVKLEKEELK